MTALMGAEWIAHLEIDRNLIVLLIFFQFPFFFWTKLGFFLLFFSAFISFSFIAHFYFSFLKITCVS